MVQLAREKGEHVKSLLLQPCCYCGRDVLIRKLQKFNIQKCKCNCMATIEEAQ